MTYQDTLAPDGSTAHRGYRECASRYRRIHKAVSSLGSGFSVLDVGASEGYFAARLATDFDAHVTAVEPRETKRIEDSRILWRREMVTPENVGGLGAFDVVLALSVLHHVAEWRGVLAGLYGVTRRFLFVETPHPGEILRKAVARNQLQEIDRVVRYLDGRVIGRTPAVWNPRLRRPLYLVERA